MSKNTKDKMIPNPENPDEEIENPDYIEPNDANDDDEDDDLSPEIKAKIAAVVQKNLQKIKTSLDKAYTARDEALTKLKEKETKEREAEIAKLKETGNLEEAYKAELADRDAKIREQESRLVRLTRDTEVRDALASFTFRNERARTSAIRDIVDELVQDDKGIWKHKTGASVNAFVKTFLEAEENSFLLKPKINTGGGSTPQTPSNPTTNKGVLLKDRDQAEVIQEIAKRRAENRFKV